MHTLDNKRVGEHTERKIFTERNGLFVRRFVIDILILSLYPFMLKGREKER